MSDKRLLVALEEARGALRVIHDQTSKIANTASKEIALITAALEAAKGKGI
jgi:hypothetical protein